MEIFKAQDFQGLKFNIYRHKNTDNLLEKEPLLKTLAGFSLVKDHEHRDKLIRYVIYLYDKSSPFIQGFQDIAERKRQVAIASGFDINKDIVILRELYEFQFEPLFYMVSDLCKEIGSNYWRLILLNEQTFYEYERVLMTEVDKVESDKEKLTAVAIKPKLLEECDRIVTRLEDYYKKVFTDPDLIDKVKRNDWRPESIAQGKR